MSPEFRNDSDQHAGAMTGAPPSLRELTAASFKIGCLGFGGPAGQIALMHRIFVDEKKWIDEPRYLHALNYCMLLPGPEAQQLAIYVGWLLHGVRGGMIAGALFVLPGAAIMLALSWLYALHAHEPLVAAAFYGIKAAVLALVVEALLKIGRRALKARVDLLMAIGAFAAILMGAPFALVIVAAALIGLGHRGKNRTHSATSTAPLLPGGGGEGEEGRRETLNAAKANAAEFSAAPLAAPRPSPPAPSPPGRGGSVLATSRKKRARKLYFFHPDKPDDWRVGFRCLLMDRRHVIPGRREATNPELAGSAVCTTQMLEVTQTCRRDAGGPYAPKRFHSAWPLAERLEAMIRVFNNPAPFAARLAARLRAFPKRAYDMLRSRFPTKPRTCSADAPPRDLVGRETFDEADDLAGMAAEWFDSS
jgi:chromate transport protein ChrA